MDVTLLFPTYSALAGFLDLTTNGNIRMNLIQKALTAAFTEEEVNKAVEIYNARIGHK